VTALTEHRPGALLVHEVADLAEAGAYLLETGSVFIDAVLQLFIVTLQLPAPFFKPCIMARSLEMNKLKLGQRADFILAEHRQDLGKVASPWAMVSRLALIR